MSSALATQPEAAPVAKASQSKLTNNVLLGASCAVLLLGPLAFGAVEPWAIFALEASATLLLVLWAARMAANPEVRFAENPVYRPMACFFVLVALQWALGTTAYRLVTYTHLLLYAAYGMLVLVVTQSLRRSVQFEVLAKLFSGYGAVVAVFAVLQGLGPNGKIYWLRTLERSGFYYGPYVNHNHYAGLMEMLVPFPLVLAASRFTVGREKLVAAGAAAVMAGSIFLSASRGGMVAFVAQMVVLGILLMRKQGARWKQTLMLGAFLGMVVIFLVWIGSDQLTQRLISIHSEAREEINGGLRLSIDRDCLRMMLKRPFLGWGIGTFPVVYPQFRSFYTMFFVNEAHNDYLQLLVEGGLVGFSLAIWLLVSFFRAALRKLDNWTEGASGALTVAALLGCIGILVHSFLDFNLQIPANAALFYVLSGIAASPPLLESVRKRQHRHRHRRHNLIVQPQPQPTGNPG